MKKSKEKKTKGITPRTIISIEKQTLIKIMFIRWKKEKNPSLDHWFKNFFRMFRAGVPNLKFTTEFMIAEGDMVAVYGFAEGTQSGEFMGIPPTGKSFKVTNADFCRFNAEGKITDHWGVFDSMGMMRQIGMIPAPGQHA